MDTERTTTANWTLRRAVGNALGYEPSPYHAWEYLDGHKWSTYPAWDTDLNVAITLMEHIPDGWYFSLAHGIGENNWSAFINYYVPDATKYIEDASTPAEAICKAFLAYSAARPPTADDSGHATA